MVRGFLKKLGRGRSEPEQTAKSRIYFAIKDGSTDDGTGGGLLNYRSQLTGRKIVLDELPKALKTHGFGYSPDGLIFQGENEEDAKNKLLNQKDNKISKNDLNRLEEEWIEKQWAEYEEEKKKDKKEELDILEKNRIPKELKKKLAGKTGIEVQFGINIDYEKAIKGIYEWKRFEN